MARSQATSTIRVEEAKVSRENRRKLWVRGVKPHWVPRPGLLGESAETIAEEVLRAHDWDLASSVSSINFYINRAGIHLSDREIAKLEHARRLIQKGGYSREEQRELEARRGHRRVAANPRRVVANSSECA